MTLTSYQSLHLLIAVNHPITKQQLVASIFFIGDFRTNIELTIICRYPSAPCSYIDQTKLASQCLQKHNFVRLLAYTYEEGLHIDSFKMPVACSCHIKGPKHHYGHGYGVTPVPHYAVTPTPVYHPPTPAYHPHHSPIPGPYKKKK